ncbi:MAG: cytochrome c-type biogenesis CcmF C-terminal domain-containing protein, partial [Stellaceae bacterium]
VSVGPPYYNLTFAPIMVPLLAAMAVGPMLPWKRGDLWAALARLKIAFVATVAAAVATLAIAGVKSLWPACGLALAAWLLTGTMIELCERLRLFSEPLGTVFRRAIRLPRASWGMTFAHAGMAVVLIGITGSTAWTRHQVVSARIGDSFHLAGYTLVLDKVRDVRGPDFTAMQADIRLLRDGTLIREMHPEKRFYRVEDGTATGVAIRTNLLADVYVVIGDTDGKGGYTLRLYYNTLVPLIWLGALGMAFGGLVSLTDRRLRIGAPSRRRALVPPTAQAAE